MASVNDPFQNARSQMQEQLAKMARQQASYGNWVAATGSIGSSLGSINVYGSPPSKPSYKFMKGDKLFISNLDSTVMYRHLDKEFGVDGEGQMLAYSGKLVTVSKALAKGYRIEEDNSGWYWAEAMFERLATPEEIANAARPPIEFDSVVIPQHKRQQILEALEQVDKQELIFQHWGFAKTLEKGKGISMLFYGPPGTGKTLMAQAIADKTSNTLKVLSTADIESSVPGEAERNIRKYFKDAKKDNKTILLFDECDSLIYSRQNVGAILGAQVNELLSQLERFEGITIFTTNRLGTLDEAVNRRLSLKLEFEMPTREERVEIWKRMFPEEAPLSKNIDWDKLAIIELAGGYIKNAVLRAVRMAAAEKIPDKDKKIRQKHLVAALQQEAESVMKFDAATEAHHRSRRIQVDAMDSSGIRKGLTNAY